MAGYPSRSDSEHDLVENSHASTILSYAYGLAAAVERSDAPGRRVVAVIGAGAPTGGMAQEGHQNLRHAGAQVAPVPHATAPAQPPQSGPVSPRWAALRPQP